MLRISTPNEFNDFWNFRYLSNFCQLLAKVMAEEKNYQKDITKVLIERPNDIVATVASNKSVTQKKVTIAETSMSTLNDITKL